MSRDSSANHRPPRSAKLRRRLGVGGLSLVATTSLLGTYLGYPGLRRAYAAVNCGSIYDEASLVFEINRMEAGSCDTLNIPAMTVSLTSDLPQVTQAGDFTINGSGQGSTIIDGQGSHSAFSFTSASTVTISGLTIQSAEVAGRGSALNAYNSAVTLDQVTFSDNQATGGGGAVYANELTVRESRFYGNDAAGNGGAIFSAGDVNVEYSRFEDNTSGNWGGAIWVEYGEADIRTTTFATNLAPAGYGGAIAIYPYALGITDSTFSDNTAVNGGAIYAYTSISVAGSTFSENTATQFGGAISGASSPPSGSTLTVTNSTFTANNAYACAAINWYDNANLNFVTVVENNSTDATNPLTPATYVKGDLNLTNSIVYGNTNASPSVTDIYAQGTFTASHSLLTSTTSFYAVGGRSLTSRIYGDPVLGTLTNNGGPTLTMMPAADSPVIGMADPTGAPAFDQRGYTRTTNGLADMGAVERGGSRPAPDLSQMPPTWFQATTRNEQADQCPANMHPSWAEWPNDNTGGWTCEWSTWWDVNKGVQGGWVTTPGFNPGRPVSE